ncbi:MAG TPA: hypothetical protein VK963_01595 [Candidatus Saccharimonadales bacterium]|nr:hypothetical protein [Candidatus Saccharimonadales bacterium]
MRDQAWLHQLLDETWDRHFSDVPQNNIVRVLFGRRAKNRLGSIKLDSREPDISIITLNGLFRDEAIPSFVVKATLVHELSHYAHGFNSPIEQKFRHPHAGGIMREEFRERGLEQLYLDQRHWLKHNWRRVVEHNFTAGVTKSYVKPKRGIKVPRPFWFIG